MHVIRNNRLEDIPDDDEDVDFELPHASMQYGTHTNSIPLQSAVQVPRLFYGGRFANQATALEKGEAPLVQNLDTSDPEGRSFDELLGERMGAIRAKAAGRVVSVSPREMKVAYDDGTRDTIDLYEDFAFNQKSVAGDTRIVIRRKAGDLWTGPIRDYVWEAGDETPAYGDDLKSAWRKVKEKIAHANDRDLLRVTYQSGRYVDVTPDHSLLRFDGERIAPVLPHQCRIGITKAPVVFAPASNGECDRNLGVLVGLYLSEGDLTAQRGLVRIAVDPPARREQVDALLRALGFTPHANKGGRASFTDYDTQKFLADNCGRGAGNKFISDRLKSSPKQFLEGLVQGFMAGDGCMESDSNGALHVHTAVTSKKLRDDLVEVLCMLGVMTTVFHRPRECYSDKWHDAYGFRVVSACLCKMERWFFYEDRHQQYVEWVSDTYRSSPFEMMEVPVGRAIKKELKPLGLDGIRAPGGASRARLDSAGSITIGKRYAESADSRFGLMARSDIMWDAVMSITSIPSEPEVYDLSVEGAESFAVNGGLLVHNSGITSRPLVKPGDAFEPGKVLSASNFTDDNGVMAMGLNARIGLVPWKGYSMDDAIPISESFAKRLSSIHYKVVRQDDSDGLKTGLSHYRAVFPQTFPKEKMENFSDDGIVKPGTILEPGDPMVLSTMPRTLSSTGANVGKLSRAMRQQRRDASQVWHGNQSAQVVSARKTRNGVKVVLKYVKPTEEGDKIVLRQGAKATVSKVIPDDQMPRTEDGQPLDAMLNPLSLVSRANPATQHELRLGKIARALGVPMKIPSYLPKGQTWNHYIDELERQHGVSAQEKLFDPESGKFLDAPVTVGYGFVNKLHHTSESKVSSRGTGSYDLNQQPARGGGENAQAKRYSGLENYATLSSGAYALLRENSTLRGQRNDEYWRALRAGKSLPRVGEPFVWHKFRALLSGAGMNTRDMGKGRVRLAPFTDADLDGHDPLDLANGEMVDLRTMTPVDGGLFDNRLLVGDRWGRIRLPRPVINPAMEEGVRVMLGITKAQLADVLAGRITLAEAQSK